MLNLPDISQTCVKCARCVPSCTIYQINRDEVTSPRGFIDLLGAFGKGKIALDRNLKNIFESCFLCTTCTTHCPQSIDTARLIQQSRIDIARKYGIAWYKRAYFFLLRHRILMDLAFSMVAFVAPCAFKRNADKLRSRVKLSRFGKRTIFPFAKRSFLQKHSKDSAKIARNALDSRDSTSADSIKIPRDSKDSTDSTNAPNPRKVAIFIGCLSNYNYPQIGESLLDILAKLGICAIIPKQECCGAPAYFTGDIATVTHLAKKNIMLFERVIGEVEAILIPEATCAAMIMVDWKHALEYDARDSAWIGRLEALLPKIFMASDWLYKRTNLLEILRTRGKNATRITYHDPCHAKKVLHIASEPRALIAANYELVEMRECDRCCGFGGVTIQSEKYHLAHNAGLAKASAIAESAAKIVSAECSACRMQINNVLDNAGVKATFKHPLELISETLNM